MAWTESLDREKVDESGTVENNLFIPIYNIGLGLDSVLTGWAISIPRFFDMVSDPLMGNLSDNCRRRFGRRRPFILVGSILIKICISAGQHVRQLLEEGGAERHRFLLRPVAALAEDGNIAPEVLGVRYVAWIAAALIILTALPASLLTGEKVHVGAATWSGLYGSTTGAFSLVSTFLIPVLVRLFDKKKVLLAGADTMSPETVVRLRLFVALFPSTCLLPAILNFRRYPLTR